MPGKMANYHGNSKLRARAPRPGPPPQADLRRLASRRAPAPAHPNPRPRALTRPAASSRTRLPASRRAPAPAHSNSAPVRRRPPELRARAPSARLFHYNGAPKNQKNRIAENPFTLRTSFSFNYYLRLVGGPAFSPPCRMPLPRSPAVRALVGLPAGRVTCAAARTAAGESSGTAAVRAWVLPLTARTDRTARTPERGVSSSARRGTGSSRLSGGRCRVFCGGRPGGGTTSSRCPRRR